MKGPKKAHQKEFGMRKSFLTTLVFLRSAAALGAREIAGASRRRRVFIVLLLIASIGCSDTSPVAPSPVAEVGATSTNLAAALQPTASGSTYTNVADALKAPVRRATHDTTSWSFELFTLSIHEKHLNKYRVVDIRSPETEDEGTHWYVQFRSIETYNGQPHERGIFVEAGPGGAALINGFWANVRYVVQVRSYAKMSPNQNQNQYYSIGENLIEVGRFTTPGCPSTTQHRDSEPHPENPYRCELIPEPPAPVVPDDSLPSGMITVAAADTWGAANNLSNFKVILTRNSGSTSYARIFIFHGGNACPATYTFRSGKYSPWPTNSRASCEKRVRPSFCLRPRGERRSADGTQRSQDDSDRHCGRGAGAAGVHGACLPVMRASTREEMRRISSTSRSSSRLFSIHSR